MLDLELEPPVEPVEEPVGLDVHACQDLELQVGHPVEGLLAEHARGVVVEVQLDVEDRADHVGDHKESHHVGGRSRDRGKHAPHPTKVRQEANAVQEHPGGREDGQEVDVGAPHEEAEGKVEEDLHIEHQPPEEVRVGEVVLGVRVHERLGAGRGVVADDVCEHVVEAMVFIPPVRAYAAKGAAEEHPGGAREGRGPREH